MSEKNKADATTDPRARVSRRDFIKGVIAPHEWRLHVANEHRRRTRATAGAFCIRGFVMAAVGLPQDPPERDAPRARTAPRV